MSERRPPIDISRFLRLIESGMGPSHAAREMGYPIGSATGLAKRLRDRGILRMDGTVEWGALDTFERSGSGRKAAEQSRYRGKGVPPGTPPCMPGVHPKVHPAEEKVHPKVYHGNEQESRGVPPGTPRTGNTKTGVVVDAALVAAMRKYAREHGMSAAETFNRAIELYLYTEKGR